MPATKTRKGRRRKFTKGASLEEFSDYELLHVVEDHESEKTDSIAYFLERSNRSLASRFMWMAKDGLIERDSEGGWVIGRNGKRLKEREADIQSIRGVAEMVRAAPTLHWVGKREIRRILEAKR